MSGKGGLPSSNLGKPTSKRHMSSLLISLSSEFRYFSLSVNFPTQPISPRREQIHGKDSSEVPTIWYQVQRLNLSESFLPA
jgi:hypothetical protein